MIAFLVAVGLVVAGGAGAVLAGRSRWRSRVAAAGIVTGSVCGLIAAVRVLAGAPVPALRAPWPVPYGSFSLAIDPVSAVFLVALFVLAPAAAVYGARYLEEEHGGAPLGGVWLFTGLLIAGMAVVFTARNGVLFLVAWEVMSVAAFFLVTFDHRRPEVREAGWTYLVATHLGTAFLARAVPPHGARRRVDGLRRHAAAAASPRRWPGRSSSWRWSGSAPRRGSCRCTSGCPRRTRPRRRHVSAVMSGVMIKTGIYGLCPRAHGAAASARVVGLARWSPSGWSSGVSGRAVRPGPARPQAAAGLPQRGEHRHHRAGAGRRPARRQRRGSRRWPLAGFAGALLHVVNHALFKGAAVPRCRRRGPRHRHAGHRPPGRPRQAHARGPARRSSSAPAAISGLPPLNGFVSELPHLLSACFAAGPERRRRPARPPPWPWSRAWR